MRYSYSIMLTNTGMLAFIGYHIAVISKPTRADVVHDKTNKLHGRGPFSHSWMVYIFFGFK